MVMICCHPSSSTSTLLLILLSIAPQLPAAAPLLTESPLTSTSNETLQLVHQELATADGATRIHRKVDRFLQPPSGQGHLTDMDSARVLASILLEALDHPVGEEVGGWVESEEYVEKDPGQELEMWRDQDDRTFQEQRVEEESGKILQSGVSERTEGEEKEGEEKEGFIEPQLSDEENENGNNESKLKGKEELLLNLLGKNTEIPSQIANTLQRKTRGYFQNIDLGLQDNEILPPLKGYKAYNQQLALASKKLKWQEEREKNPSQLDRNFMDDFDFIEEEEVLPREEEEARARAEQEEVRRQEAEAQEARDEEQRLADIASDMLLEYMGRKQKAASYMKDMTKTSLFNNVAEDKRSNEVEDSDDDEMDPETIDKLIEISSKLHLPADDVVEIISDVEEKKKRKDSPPVNAPRFRPLVPLKAKQRPPVYQYPQKPPKKSSYKVNPYKKWYKEKSKAKFNKQDYWFKPQKQLLAYRSFPYYQKPYRAYYPVYFPPPEPRFYTNPTLSFDYNFGGPVGYGFKPPKRRYRDRTKAKERNWVQGPRQPQNPYPLVDTVISNYILPHPRTYQTLPVPKPRSPPSAAAPSYFFHPDYAYDEPEPVPGSDEELENFIEKIYYNRRLF